MIILGCEMGVNPPFKEFHPVEFLDFGAFLIREVLQRNAHRLWNGHIEHRAVATSRGREKWGQRQQLNTGGDSPYKIDW